MKVHLRFDRADSQHCHMTIFVNGQNNGNLCMSKAQAVWFHHILAKGTESLGLPFVASGKGPAATTYEIDSVIKIS